ncbi:MAG TPA: carbohydrate ABC transporter permease [Phycisphaerae bacterium]|nr:carbohydrate ABC transporter permease [Phycisphaerae bacterium]
MRSRTRTILVLACLIIGSVAMIFPFWWMATTSLSTEAQATEAASGFRAWPTDPQWQNYPNALRKMGSKPWIGFLDALTNTVVITTLCVVGQVVSCSLVGYAFARMRFRGRATAFIVMIATMMLPMQVTMIPMFIMFRRFGWIDTMLPLIVPTFFGTPFFIFMFRQFFAQIPEALVEAARIDGCGHLRIWLQIMLPICKPVIAITAIFTFIGAWNDFMGPLIYLQSEDQMTLAVALNSFQNQYGDFRDAHYLMAASIVTMIPCIILFFVAQKQFVSGLSLGAVKG